MSHDFRKIPLEKCPHLAGGIGCSLLQDGDQERVCKRQGARARAGKTDRAGVICIGCCAEEEKKRHPGTLHVCPRQRRPGALQETVERPAGQDVCRIQQECGQVAQALS